MVMPRHLMGWVQRDSASQAATGLLTIAEIDRLSPAEQCKLVASHAIVVIGHGGGVPATLMCAHVGAVVIEIHPPNFSFYGFNLLARAMRVTLIQLFWPPQPLKGLHAALKSGEGDPRKVKSYVPNLELLRAAVVAARKLVARRAHMWAAWHAELTSRCAHTY